MTLKKYFFRKKHISLKKLFIVFFVVLLLINAVGYLIHHLPLELYRVKEMSIEDVDFTDIYYQASEPSSSGKKDILLVNTGTLPTDSLRRRLADIIKAAESSKAIGMDLYFDQLKNDTAANIELDRLIRQKKVVIGMEYENWSIFPLDSTQEVNFGYINLPDAVGTTMREYYNFHTVKFRHPLKDTIIRSFARKLYQLSYGNATSAPVDSLFRIKYSTTEKGFYNVLRPEIFDDTLRDFPAIEATDLLMLATMDSAKLKTLIQDKIIIMGWLGSPDMEAKTDITDKHKVPVDFHLFNRSPTMPGMVIHANALQMMISKTYIRNISNWIYLPVLYGLVFLYLLIIMSLERIRPFFIKLIVDLLILFLCTILLIWFSVYLMKKGYHLKVGEILFYLVALLEFKGFVFDFYEYLEKKWDKFKNNFKEGMQEVGAEQREQINAEHIN